MRIRSAMAILALCSASLPALAADITYNVNESFSGVSAVGTITTDGTIGPLTDADIVGFSITITQGANHGVVTTTPAMFSSDLSATATGLFYDFSDSFSYFGLGNPSTYGICFGDQGGCDGVDTGVFIVANGLGVVGPTLSGTQEIAAVVTTTPEPSSIALLGTGLLGVAGALRKRFV